MSISSLSAFRTLKASLITTLARYSISFYNKYSNQSIDKDDKAIYILLVRHINFILNVDVYEEHDLLHTYEEGEFVIDGVNYYICVKDVETLGNLITDTTYWLPSVSFTYNYDAIAEALNNINRICRTNYTI